MDRRIEYQIPTLPVRPYAALRWSSEGGSFLKGPQAAERVGMSDMKFDIEWGVVVFHVGPVNRVDYNAKEPFQFENKNVYFRYSI